jgi:hypothetical protein
MHDCMGTFSFIATSCARGVMRIVPFLFGSL